jgi:ferredoxin
MNGGNTMSAPPPLTVLIDARLCEGHGLCLHLAPHIFALTDDEISVCPAHPDPTHLAEITAAAAACPRQAITVTPLPERCGKENA